MQNLIGKNRIQKYVKLKRRKYITVVNRQTGESICVPNYEKLLERETKSLRDNTIRFFKMVEFHEFLKRLNNVCPVANVHFLLGHEDFNSLFCDISFGSQIFVIKFNKDLSLKKIYCQTFGDAEQFEYFNYDDFFNDKDIKTLFEFAIARRMVVEPYFGKSKFID